MENSKQFQFRNYRQIESFIKNRPRESQEAVSLWIAFTKRFGAEAWKLSSYAEFVTYVTRLGLQIDKQEGVWTGREILEAYSTLRSEEYNQAPVSPHPRFPLNLSMLPAATLLLFEQPQIMEHDKKYQLLLAQKAQEWLRNNPGKDLSSQEGLDYFFGSLTGQSQPTLSADTETAFRATYPKLAVKYDKKHAKIYKKAASDPRIHLIHQEINQHAVLRFQCLHAINPTTDFDSIYSVIEKRAWDRYVLHFPQHAIAYSAQSPQIAAALQRHQVTTTQPPQAQPSPIPSPAPHPLPQQATIPPLPPQTPPQGTQITQATSPSQHPPSTGAPLPNQPPHLNKPPPAQLPPKTPQAPAQTQASPLFQRVMADIRRRAGIISQLQKRTVGRTAQRVIPPLASSAVTAGNRIPQLLGGLNRVPLSGAIRGVGVIGSPVLLPYIIIGCGALLVIILVFLIVSGTIPGVPGFPGFPGVPQPTPGTPLPSGTPDQSIPNLTIEKKYPESVPNPGSTARIEDGYIRYEIIVCYNGSLDVTIYDPLPANTSLVDTPGINTSMTNTTMSWALKDNDHLAKKIGGCEKQYTFPVVVQPQKSDTYVENQAYAQALGGQGSLDALLPNPLPEQGSLGQEKVKQIIDYLYATYPGNIDVYKQAEAATGVPWQILAGIHYREGGMNPNQSLASGENLNTPSPDLNGKCSSEVTGPGIPIPLDGGCGFTNLLDSAIFAGKHFLEKDIRGAIGMLESFDEVVSALSRYNGGGNSNCGKTVPYSNASNCPPLFYGEDDPYPLAFFDKKHEEMFLIYCANYTPCSPPRRFEGLGALTITRGLVGRQLGYNKVRI